MIARRVDTVELFGPMRRALVDLLASLTDDDWKRPTVCGAWDVRDVVMHLVGVDTAYVSRHRDGHRIASPATAVELGPWLHRFNESWVEAGRRLSGPVLVDLLDAVGPHFDEHVRTIDLDPVTSNVSWASDEPVPVWLDVAREYTERWVHQQQIREAVAQQGLDGASFVGPVLATFVHALPMALRSVAAAGVVELRVTGTGGGTWHVTGGAGRWELRDGAADEATARLTTDAGNAWRLFTRHPAASPPEIEGDPTMGRAAANAVAIIV